MFVFVFNFYIRWLLPSKPCHSVLHICIHIYECVCLFSKILLGLVAVFIPPGHITTHHALGYTMNPGAECQAGRAQSFSGSPTNVCAPRHTVWH